MTGLNYGRKYLHSENKRINTRENDLNREGVIFNAKAKKWLVRVRNQTRSKHLKHFNSVAQFDNKEDADKYWAGMDNKDTIFVDA